MKFSNACTAAWCATLMCVPAWVAAQTVTSFTVVNADTGADIATFTASGTVSLSATPRINVRANASGVGSVVFSGSSSRTESTAPYALMGDKNGVYNKWSPAPGTYTINARPFTGRGGSGTAGPIASLALTIVRTLPSGTAPTVSAGADATLTLPSNASSMATMLSGAASDADGTVVSYLWTQVSGPNQAAIASAAANNTQVTGLIAGAYTFRLTARDNDGNSASDDVNVRVTANQPQTGTGRLIIDPANPRAFVYDRDRDGDGRLDPAYMAAVGGPEGFLYLSNARKQQIIDRLLRSPSVNSPVNGIYFHSTRAFGGDGGDAESPFIVNKDPKSGIDPNKLASWLVDLKRLDDAGVILWFNLFDDHSIPYGCKDNADYRNYATFMVNYFKALKHVVWVTQEEYDWSDGSMVNCTKADNDGRQIGLAAAIRAADPTRPIATHHRGDKDMQFPNDPNIGVYAQQTFNRRTAEAMHDSAGKQGQGNWVYVMAEAHPWHKELIAAGNRTVLRRSNWATAMAGGHVAMYDSFESKDPTDGMLDDLRQLRLFMESTAFDRMKPLFDAELSGARLDNTKYLLANPSLGLYILYGEFDAGKMGVRGAPAGTYALKWFDPASGQTVDQTFSVGSDGLASFTKPASFGPEVALYLRKQ